MSKWRIPLRPKRAYHTTTTHHTTTRLDLEEEEEKGTEDGRTLDRYSSRENVLFKLLIASFAVGPIENEKDMGLDALREKVS